MRPFFDVGDADAVTNGPFEAYLSLALLDGMMVGECRTFGQTFRRDRLKVLSEGLDHYIIQVFTEGQTSGRFGGRQAQASPGDIWVLDMASELDAENTQFHNLSLVVPRAMIAPALRAPDMQHGRTIPADTPIARIFRTYLASLTASLGTLTPGDAAALTPTTSRLVEALLNSRDDAPRPEMAMQTSEMATLFTAKQAIEQHLSDPMLSPDTVAGLVGVSRATLYRLFAPLGGVASFTRTRRLRRSIRDLLDPAQSNRRINEICFAWGFRSESDYSRAFKQHFGMSPSEARAAGQAARLDRDGPSASASDLEHERWLFALAR